jgi:hypothetical protein
VATGIDDGSGIGITALLGKARDDGVAIGVLGWSGFVIPYVPSPLLLLLEGRDNPM